MKCHILVLGKNKKNIINLSSAENFTQRVVKVKCWLLQLCFVFCLCLFLVSSSFLVWEGCASWLCPEYIHLSIRKHAYSNILKISPPKTESSQI